MRNKRINHTVNHTVTVVEQNTPYYVREVTSEKKETNESNVGKEDILLEKSRSGHDMPYFLKGGYKYSTSLVALKF